MKKQIQKITSDNFLWFNLRKLNVVILFLLMATGASVVTAQNKTIVKGVVLENSTNEPILGATVVVKGGQKGGTMTDINGRFSIEVPNYEQILIISYIGLETQEVALRGRSEISVSLKENENILDEVIVVGYGQQKKASIVGAITQTKGEVLERAGGVSSVGAALTGNLPGVITTASTGMPGEEDPIIYIRGRSSWNNSDPLVLVDGIERPMTSVDINSVESISVLKDASATAVFGVKGANGVILITTKRGNEGKAKIDIGFSSTVKVPSQLPNKYDSYDALMMRNRVSEYELGNNPNAWNNVTPQDIIEKYRNPADQTERERYANIDWADELFKDYTMAYNANINISGGTKFVKYFAGIDYQNEGDLFENWDNSRGYTPGYGYNRINARSNLDFQLTKSTTFTANLFGSYGIKKSPWGATGNEYSMWQGAYSVAPDAFYPQYSDGTWGYYPQDEVAATNSAMNLALSGLEQKTTTRINTDFTLKQDLSMILRGLSLQGTISWDNVFVEAGRGINDLYNSAQVKWIDPKTGKETYKYAYNTTTNFDFHEGVLWSTEGGAMQNWSTLRNLFYQMQLNYGVKLGNHNITAMGLFGRTEKATGSEIPHFREDWVFRTTYDYKGKYFVEYNGAYNGSEKFSAENRYAFFSSGAIGWMLSEEKFMKSLTFLDMMKIRFSYGQIGDDNISTRWLYMTQWAYGNTAMMGPNNERSPYTWYRESAVGNPNVHWETVTKANLGVDYAFFNGLLAGSVDFFRDNRTDILIAGSSRAIPSYYGTTAPAANLGRVLVNGFELELRFNKMFSNGVRLWANASMTHAKNKILEADDASLLPDYQKKEGKQIGQSYTYVGSGMYNTYDELYASTQYDSNDDQKIPGNYLIVDYNGDGVINSYDNIPYGYSSTPENTYNGTLGVDWKGFSAFVQFYGVNNVSRQVVFTSFGGDLNTVYDEGTFWSKDDVNADSPLPRLITSPGSYYNGNRYFYDGSYIRLKNMEIGYTFNSGWVKNLGIGSLKVYLNGNNLWVWSRMPDDRESNFAGTGWASQGAYPTVKRFNLGLKITL